MDYRQAEKAAYFALAYGSTRKMGCDIHMVAETWDGMKWVCATEFGDPYDDGYVSPIKEPFFGRNYFLFGVLAGVRWDEPEQIAELRGVPDDASPEYEKWATGFGCDGHSHSYIDLQELLDFNWMNMIEQDGIITAVNYLHWRGYQKEAGFAPDEYCGSVYGPTVLSEEEVEDLIALARGEDFHSLKAKFEKGNEHVRVTWEESYSRGCRSFMTDTIPYLLSLANNAGVSYREVRICFFFDN